MSFEATPDTITTVHPVLASVANEKIPGCNQPPGEECEAWGSGIVEVTAGKSILYAKATLRDVGCAACELCVTNKDLGEDRYPFEALEVIFGTPSAAIESVVSRAGIEIAVASTRVVSKALPRKNYPD